MRRAIKSDQRARFAEAGFGSLQILIAGGDSITFAQEATPATAASTKIPNEKLDSLVAPIALYPDSLLGQVLVAATTAIGADGFAGATTQGKEKKPPDSVSAWK